MDRSDRRRRQRKLAATGFVIALASWGGLALSGGALRAAPSITPPQRQALAKKLLETRGEIMTGSAQTMLRFISGDGLQVALPEEKELPSAPAATGAAGPASTFTNVRVNDPAADRIQVDQTTQSETTIAVAGSNVAVGYNDSQHTLLSLTAGSSISGYSYSSDGGRTWTDGGALPNKPEFVNFGDPWLTSDRAGNMYYATLALDAFNLNGDLAVAKSTNGGRTWSTPTPVIRPPFEVFYFADKEAITAGPDPIKASRDNLYVAWDDFSFDSVTEESFSGLPVARSTDGGASWQTTYADKVPQDQNGCSFAQYIGAQPIVDPTDGTLFVAAEKIEANDPRCNGATLTLSEWIFRSADGGQTFDPGVKIGGVTPATPDGLLALGQGRYMRTIEFPVAAFLDGSLYVAWNDSGLDGHSHIRLAASSDEGATWSRSWATRGTADEVQPALSGDGSGLHLLYYQRNADNTLDVVLGDSTNGSSFRTSRVTTRSFPGVFTVPQFDPIISWGYMGDYIANVTDGQHQYFAWGDNRGIVRDFLWPRGRHDPDVFFAKQ